jgi:hypothetical protein
VSAAHAARLLQYAWNRYHNNGRPTPLPKGVYLHPWDEQKRAFMAGAFEALLMLGRVPAERRTEMHSHFIEGAELIERKFNERLAERAQEARDAANSDRCG